MKRLFGNYGGEEVGMDSTRPKFLIKIDYNPNGMKEVGVNLGVLV